MTAGDTDRAFPGATCGCDLVPGVPGRVIELADQLTTVSQGLFTVCRVLQGIQVIGWDGVAAQAFRRYVDIDERPYAVAGAVTAQASEQLRSHATVLARAQRRADDAVLTDLQAAWATMTWRQNGSGGPDPGLVLRAAVVADVAAARADVRSSAAFAAAGLNRARGLAPPTRSRLARATAQARAAARDVDVGMAESVAGLLGLALTFSQARLLVDPLGMASDVADAGRQGAAAVRHPKQLAAALVDAETFGQSKARWVGRLAPDVAITAATGGAGVASRSSTFTTRLRSLGPGERAAALRQAVADARGGGRSGLRLRDVRAYASEPSPLGTVTRLDAVPHAVAQAAGRDAGWAEPVISARIERVADRLGARQEGSATALKGQDSLNRKVSDEFARAPSSSPGQVLRRVNDTIRYTLTYPDQVYVPRALDTIRELRAEGLELAEVKSTWGGPRYQGLNVTFKDPPTGRLVEVQVHTPSSWQATVTTHDDYKLFRDAGIDPAYRAVLERRIGAVYQAVPRPDGVTHLAGATDALRPDALAVAGPPTLLSTDPRRLAAHVGLGLPVLVVAQPTSDPPAWSVRPQPG